MTRTSSASMPSLTIQNSAGDQIRSLEDWFRYAPPKRGAAQWKDGRSAKELAQAWLRGATPGMPNELGALLSSHAITDRFIPEVAIPEYVTRLDQFRGEHRNHDLIVVDRAGSGRVLLAVEGKADEAFGSEVRAMRGSSPRSNLPARIDLLARALFGRPIDGELGKLHQDIPRGTIIPARPGRDQRQKTNDQSVDSLPRWSLVFRPSSLVPL